MSKSGVFARCLSCLLLPYRVKPQNRTYNPSRRNHKHLSDSSQSKKFNGRSDDLCGMETVFLNIKFLEVTFNYMF